MTVHHPHRFGRTLATCLAVTALVAPAATARPPDPDPFPSRGGGTSVNVDPEPAPAHAPIVRTIDGGFDWGSAAIGAGSVGGVVLLVSLGGLAYSSRGRMRVAP